MRSSRAAAVVLVVLLAGCGSAKPTNFSDVLSQAGSKTTQAGSSRISLVSESDVAGQHVTINADGVLKFAGNLGKTSVVMHVPGSPDAITITELITGGFMYLSVPGQPGYYKISLADLVGTQFANSSDPAAAMGVLLGVSGPITKVGTETVRGTKTTHVSGTIDLAKAAARAEGAVKAMMQKALSQAKTPSSPFDAWVDDQGRLRKLVQHLTLTIKGQDVVSTTTMEYYDFGTPVSVTAPPASEVKDGAPILAAIKAQAG